MKIVNCKWKILAILLVFSIPGSVFAVSDSTDVNLNVETEICNNNGICEPERGETSANCPNDCPAAPVPGGAVIIFDITPPVIYDLFISKITLNSATIFWKTNESAFCQIFFGQTQDYEEKAISEGNFYLEHSTKLADLLPKTGYHFKIICKDRSGNEVESEDQQFTTLTPPDTTPPANVRNFEAVPGNRKIVLYWENPPDLDFKETKITRSTDFYPKSLGEGVLVYIGDGTLFEDINLINGITYYYTAFSYDKVGNHSSGAIVSAIPETIPVAPPIKPPVKPPVVTPPSEIEKLTLKDFDFWQLGEKLSLIEEKNIKLVEEISLTVSIDYEKVPEDLKTIIISLEKDEKYFSFLFKINREQTKYFTTLSPLEEGIYPINLHLLDFKDQTVKTISGQLIVEKAKILLERIPWYKNLIIWLYILLIALLIGIIIIIYLLYLLKKKKKRDMEDEYHY
jgi:hypothetical protein